MVKIVNPMSNPKAGGPSCWLSMTAYSIYSQLPFISGGHLSCFQNPRTCLAMVTSDPHIILSTFKMLRMRTHKRIILPVVLYGC